MKHIYILFALFFCISACKTKVYTSDTTELRKITFGSGGGITGEYTTYVLLENGQLFNQRSLTDKAFVPLSSLDKKQTEQMFKNFYSLNLNRSILSDPGNMTYFLEMKSADSTHRLSWGGMQQTVNKDIKTYYKTLLKLAQRQQREVKETMSARK